jgi:DNA-directed RNA polymerase II subunit RPB1
VTCKLSSEALQAAEAEMTKKFHTAKADASEMVGVVAAQSISEPTTQLTLNTFHLSGVASASRGVRGVPRLKEIIDCTASKNLKTPIMTVYLEPGVREDRVACVAMKNRLQTTRLRDLVRRSRIYFDPDSRSTRIEKDSVFVELYDMFRELSDPVPSGSPWLLRLELDRERMHAVDLKVSDVDDAVQSFYGDRVSTVFSDDNASEIVMRLRLAPVTDDLDGQDALTELKALEHSLLNVIPVRGIPGI